jgi:hypothetical protein
MDITLALYLLAVVEDGDYLNDWLTHLPFWAIDTAQAGGWLLSLALGY